jgi:hypothetical protein
MKWIRVDVGIAADPKLDVLSEALGVRLAEAIGLVVSVLCQFPDHARDGNIKSLPESTIEKWAGWRGKRGAFATAFRDTFCTDGVVSGWQKHNGSAVEKSDKDTRRQAEYRARKAEQPRETPPHVTRDNTRDNARDILRDGTERNVKEEERGRETAAPPPPSGLSAEFADPGHRDAYLGARRSARNPDTFDAMLGSLASGMGAPRGQPLTWHQLGTAILQILGQPTPPPLSANVLGGYAAKVPAAPITPTISLFRDDLPGTIRDATGRVVWHPGQPAPRPSDDEISGNGWSVAA